MASIQRRPNGKWRARYRGPDGREHARHFDRRVDAQRWLDEQTAALVTGQYADPRAGRVTFRTVAEQWRATAPHGPTTRYLVAGRLNKHVYPTLGDLPIASVRTTSVQSMVAAWSTILAPSTVRAVYSDVVSVFQTAVRDKLIPSSPCDGVRLPKARRKEVDIPPLEVLDTLFGALPPRLAAVVPLVAGSGLRQGEVFGLEVDAVDFLRSRAVDVRQQLITTPRQPPYLGPPKTHHSHRVVPLAPVTLDVLAAHLAAFPARAVSIWDRTDPRKPVEREARFVFALEDRTPVTRHAWSNTWPRAARTAGLPPRTGLHALRHFYASLLIRRGESAKTVQQRLGHSSAAFTWDVYTHLWPDSDDRTREAIQEALGDPADSPRTVRGGS